MFESLYPIFTVLVLLFITPLLLSLSGTVARAIRGGLFGILVSPWRLLVAGKAEARKLYKAAIPLRWYEYLALLALLTLNAAIISFGITLSWQTVWSVISVGGAITALLLTEYFILHR